MPNLASLQQIWKNLTLVQRVMLAGVLALVFGGIIAVSTIASKPSYGVLFSNLSPEDAGAVVNKLRDQKVDYQLSQGGRTVEVPVEKVYDLRLTMATEGLPKGGTIGFELFDKPNFGATDFTQHLNYQRALQGELTRTINQLEGVMDSRVHIAMPEHRLFSEKEEPATASVVLHLRPGTQLDEHRVAGIVHLVSASVEGLKPENVTVHDAEGEQLTSSENTGPAVSNTQAQMQERYERRLESELKHLADQVLGPGKSAIRVSAELNWDQTETVSESYKPNAPGGKSLITDEQSNSVTYNKRPANANKGVPGVTSNINKPAVASGNDPAATVTTPGEDNGKYADIQTNNRYAVDKVVEKKVQAPGKLRRLSIAVLLDKAVDANQQQALKDAFAAAAGLDITPTTQGGRGDRIELLPTTFDHTAQQEETKLADTASKQAFQTTMIRNGSAVAVAALMMVAALILLRRMRTPQRPRFEAVISEAAAIPAETAAGLPDAAEAEGVGVGTGIIDAPFEPLTTTPALNPGLEQLKQLAAENPEHIARELQIWMAE